VKITAKLAVVNGMLVAGVGGIMAVSIQHHLAIEAERIKEHDIYRNNSANCLNTQAAQLSET